VQIGPIRLNAPADPLALWIVDGLQRLGTLAGSLLRDQQIAPPAFRLGYDLESDVVREREFGGESSVNLLPLDVLADASDFSDWLKEQGAYAAPYAEKAVEVRARILEYPLTLVRLLDITMDSAADAFIRLNSSGIALSRVDLISARNPAMVPASEAGLQSVADRLHSLGFGRVPPEMVRARILLRRWLWRVMGKTGVVPRPAVSGRDSSDASLLLRQVSSRRPGETYLSRIGYALALSILEPVSLATGKRLNVPEVLEEYGQRAFRQISGGSLVLSPPDEGPIEDLIRAAADKPGVLATHALDQEALTFFVDGEMREFRQHRRGLLAQRLLAIADGLAEWGVSDRPAISDLIVPDDQPDELTMPGHDGHAA
jgi:hypothetical protein